MLLWFGMSALILALTHSIVPPPPGVSRCVYPSLHSYGDRRQGGGRRKFGSVKLFNYFVLHTEHGSHDPNAGTFPLLIRSADAEFRQGRQAGRGEFRAGAFGRHGLGLVCFVGSFETGCYR